MAISSELMYAILSMDAYNRGYNPGILLSGSNIGTASIGSDELLPEGSEAAGFYAVAYEDVTHGNIIAYRGTDNFWNEIPAEVIPIALNDDYDEELVHLASRFYLAAFGEASDYSVTLTGHSLGGGLAGFTGSLHNQNIVSVATIGFWPAFQGFWDLIDRYLFVKGTPQASTDTWDAPGILGPVNTVEFAEAQLTAMGISPNDIPSLDNLLDHYTAFHASGEIAEIVRPAATPSTPILEGQLPDMGDLVGLGNAHSISFTVILKYIQDMLVPLDFQPVMLPLFSALFDGQLADLAGAEVSGSSGKATVMRDAIAYSAIDEGTLVFGNMFKAMLGVSLFEGVDPLVLDLDGDGLELTARTNLSPVFDLDGDGFAEQTGWVRPDDGLLAYDQNASGQIDDIGELFGNPTTSGFAQLAAHDGNADGVINAQDAIFADLRVWSRAA